MGRFQGCRDGSGLVVRLQERAGDGMEFAVQALALPCGSLARHEAMGLLKRGPAVRVTSSARLPEAGAIARGGLGM